MAAYREVMRLVGRAFMGLGAALSVLPGLVGWAGFEPTGWDVQIISYSRGPDYLNVYVDAPADAYQVKVYEFEHTWDAQPYNVETKTIHPDPDTGESNFQIYDMVGGGAPTYIKMTWVDFNGVESPMPAYFWVMTLDVPVWIDGISKSALEKLQDAISNLENTIGIGQVNDQGQTLIDSLRGLRDSGLSGAGSGDLAFTVPIVHSKWGNVDATLFSSDEMAKLTWLSYVRTGIQAAMWITFVVYMVARFSPMFKV